MARSPCSSNEEGLNRGTWTAQEDIILSEYIRIHGAGRWKTLPRKAGLKRCGKSCRLRWLNYLRPEIIRGSISLDEEELIIRMHRLLGNRWSLIAGRLPGRTDNEIKNYWNTNLKKKLHSKKQSESKTMSKSPSPLQNHVIKSTPVRITTAVKHCEMVSLNGCNGFDRSNPKSSNHASEFSTIEEITNSSKPWCNLVVKDSITEDHPELNLRDVNLVETETRNATLGDPQSPVHCENFAATLAESLYDLNQLSSPHCNLLSSPSSFLTNLGLEELIYTGAETEECEAVCSDESNMPHINSSTFADPHGGVEIYDTIYHVDWIHEYDYIWN